MVKIVENDQPVDGNYTLQYYFDGEDWCQKWEKKLDASEMVDEYHAQELEIIRQQVLDGELSPLVYYIRKNLLDVNMLSSYTGISKRHIKKHFKPEKFNQLSEEILKKYAIAFQIQIEELKKV